MKRAWLILLLVIFTFTACTKDSDKTKPTQEKDKQPADPGVTTSDLFSGFDAKAELEFLQGTWEVKETFSGKASWTIKGDKLIRKTGDKEEQGKIEIPYPGKVVFVQEKAGGTQRTFYGYARSGDDAYIGLGKAGVKVGNRYMLAVDGLLIKVDDTCKYHKKKMFEGFEKDGLSVKCEIINDSDKKVLAYEVPDSFKKGELVK
ncbi:MAG: hypothetical protein JRJ19_00360, partial [Deltaproteobacteria bacterium]|nr:hypothetical protein [Deltaproteobacteria bacterium]